MIATNRRSIRLAAAFLLLGTATAAAQGLTPGQRIQVTSAAVPSGRQAGELRWFDRDSLVLAANGRRWVVPRHLVTQIESWGGRPRPVLAGLAAGATVAAVGAAIALSPYGTCTGSGDYLEWCRTYFTGSVVLGGGLGALTGALIRAERWIALPLDAHEFDHLVRTLRPGQRVRIRSRSGSTVDLPVASADGDSLVLSSAGSSVAFHAGTIDSLWVRQGRDGEATRTLLGAAIGAFGVFLVSIPLCERGDLENAQNVGLVCSKSGMTRAESVFGGAALGAAIGFFVLDKWRLRYVGNVVVDARVTARTPLSVALALPLP